MAPSSMVNRKRSSACSLSPTRRHSPASPGQGTTIAAEASQSGYCPSVQTAVAFLLTARVEKTSVKKKRKITLFPNHFIDDAHSKFSRKSAKQDKRDLTPVAQAAHCIPGDGSILSSAHPRRWCVALYRRRAPPKSIVHHSLFFTPQALLGWFRHLPLSLSSSSLSSSGSAR